LGWIYTDIVAQEQLLLNDTYKAPSSFENRLYESLGDFGFQTEHFFVGADAGLTFGLARLGRHADPFEFAFEGLLPFRFGLLFEADALLLLFKPGGVVSLPGDTVAAVEFEDPASDVIEEVAVVGDGDDGTLVVAQVMFEPGHGLGVEVVGGLVEQEDVGFGEQETGEGDAATFAAGADLDGRIPGGQRSASMATSRWLSRFQVSCLSSCS